MVDVSMSSWRPGGSVRSVKELAKVFSSQKAKNTSNEADVIVNSTHPLGPKAAPVSKMILGSKFEAKFTLDSRSDGETDIIIDSKQTLNNKYESEYKTSKSTEISPSSKYIHGSKMESQTKILNGNLNGTKSPECKTPLGSKSVMDSKASMGEKQETSLIVGTKRTSETKVMVQETKVQKSKTLLETRSEGDGKAVSVTKSIFETKAAMFEESKSSGDEKGKVGGVQSRYMMRSKIVSDQKDVIESKTVQASQISKFSISPESRTSSESKIAITEVTDDSVTDVANEDSNSIRSASLSRQSSGSRHSLSRQSSTSSVEASIPKQLSSSKIQDCDSKQGPRSRVSPDSKVKELKSSFQSRMSPEPKAQEKTFSSSKKSLERNNSDGKVTSQIKAFSSSDGKEAHNLRKSPASRISSSPENKVSEISKVISKIKTPSPEPTDSEVRKVSREKVSPEPGDSDTPKILSRKESPPADPAKISRRVSAGSSPQSKDADSIKIVSRVKSTPSPERRNSETTKLHSRVKSTPSPEPKDTESGRRGSRSRGASSPEEKEGESKSASVRSKSSPESKIKSTLPLRRQTSKTEIEFKMASPSKQLPKSGSETKTTLQSRRSSDAKAKNEAKTSMKSKDDSPPMQKKVPTKIYSRSERSDSKGKSESDSKSSSGSESEGCQSIVGTKTCVNTRKDSKTTQECEISEKMEAEVESERADEVISEADQDDKMEDAPDDCKKNSETLSIEIKSMVKDNSDLAGEVEHLERNNSESSSRRQSLISAADTENSVDIISNGDAALDVKSEEPKPDKVESVKKPSVLRPEIREPEVLYRPKSSVFRNEMRDTDSFLGNSRIIDSRNIKPPLTRTSFSGNRLPSFSTSRSMKLDLEMKEEKVTALTRELDDLTYGSHDAEEVNTLKRAKHELDSKLKDQEEELDELAGQVQMLEQARLRLEMQMETTRKEHRREVTQKDDEIDEVRCNAHKKVKALEAQLEAEHEERTALVREKHEMERRLIEATEHAHQAYQDETVPRLKRDLKRTKALLRDAHASLERAQNDTPSRGLIRQLRNQLEDAEFAKSAAVKGKQVAEAELADVMQLLEESQRARQDLDSQISTLQRERNDYSNHLEENEDELQEVLKKYKAAVSQLTADQITITEQANDIQLLEMEKNKLKETVAEVTTRLENLEGDSGTVSHHTHKRLEMKVRELESRLDLEQTSKQRLENQITRLKESIDKLASEADGLRLKEQEAIEASRKLSRQLREQRDESASLRLRDTEASLKKTESDQKIQTLQLDLQTARGDLKIALQRIQDLQAAMQGDDSDSSEQESDAESSSSDTSIESFLAVHTTSHVAGSTEHIDLNAGVKTGEKESYA